MRPNRYPSNRRSRKPQPAGSGLQAASLENLFLVSIAIFAATKWEQMAELAMDYLETLAWNQVAAVVSAKDGRWNVNGRMDGQPLHDDTATQIKQALAEFANLNPVPHNSTVLLKPASQPASKTRHSLTGGYVALTRTPSGLYVALVAVPAPEQGLDPNQISHLQLLARVLSVAAENQVLMSRLQHEIEQRLQGDILEELLLGSEPDQEELARKAAYLDLNLSHTFGLAVLEEAPPRVSELRPDRPIWPWLESSSRGLLPHSRIFSIGGYSILLTPIPPDQGQDPALLELAKKVEAICFRVEERSGAHLVAGIGAPCQGIPGLRRAYNQALVCLRWLKRFNHPGGPRVWEYKQLGIYRLLGDLQEGSLDRFARETLGALLLGSGNNHRNATLLGTLEAYLDTGGNTRRTAEQLAVHTGTVKYRLRRIKEITGYNLEDPEERLNLHMALRVYRLLQPLGP